MNQFYGFVNQSINQSINLYVYDTMIEYSTNSYQSNFNVVKSNRWERMGRRQGISFNSLQTNKEANKQAKKGGGERLQKQHFWEGAKI